jgi:hypothetical protein
MIRNDPHAHAPPFFFFTSSTITIAVIAETAATIRQSTRKN